MKITSWEHNRSSQPRPDRPRLEPNCAALLQSGLGAHPHGHVR